MAGMGEARLTAFEVHALHGERWLIDRVAADRAAAFSSAQQLLSGEGVGGVRVWQELFDPATGQSAARLLLEQLKRQHRHREHRPSGVREPAARPSPPLGASAVVPRLPRVATPSLVAGRSIWSPLGLIIGGLAFAVIVAAAVLG
jgi:hypothetical protein